MTGEDYLHQADLDLRIAREEYADACRCVAGWNARHPEYSQLPSGQILRQFFPDHPEWRALKSRENRSHHAMCQALERRARVIEQYKLKPEAKHVAGVLVP